MPSLIDFDKMVAIATDKFETARTLQIKRTDTNIRHRPNAEKRF